MAFGIASEAGVDLVASVVSGDPFDPVFDTPLDVSFLWQLLPDWYRNFMEDQSIFELAWSSTLQALSAAQLDLWQVGFARSIANVPVVSQRKWIPFELLRSVDFLTDPGLTTVGQDGVFTYSASEDRTEATWTGRGGIDRASVALAAPTTEEASLCWSVAVSVSSVDAKGAALFGFFNSAEASLRNALTLAIVGDNVSAGQPSLAILHYAPGGQLTVSRSAAALRLGTEYRLEADFTARTSTVVARAIELRAVKLAGTTGATPESIAGSVFTAEFTAETNFADEGVVPGDVLTVDGEDRTVRTVTGTLLSVSPATLPVGNSGLGFVIRGEVQQTSLSLDLAGDAADPTFTVDVFGTSNIDIRTLDAVLIAPVGEAARARLVGSTRQWGYLDPTVSDILLSVPRLQDTVTSPSDLLFEGTDYSISAVEGQGSTFLFQEPPTRKLYAEFAGYDEGFVLDGFGKNVGLSEISSDAYKARVQGLHYAYFQGPTISAIRAGVHILIGLPIAQEAGTVESVNTHFSGLLGQVRVSGVDYTYPLSVGTDLQQGDAVSLYQPLSRGVEVVDIYTDPSWWASLANFNELQKYHSYRVFLSVDTLETFDDIEFAGAFIQRIDPTWKKQFLSPFKALQDDIQVADDIALGLGLVLWDVPCDVVLVRYDSRDFEGEFLDWRYDQGRTDWTITSGSMRATATPLAGTASLTNGVATATVSGGNLVAEAGGPGAVVDIYIAAALVTTGLAGETKEGSGTFTDAAAQAFVDVVAGDRIEVAGEGTFEVQSVDSDNQLTLDGPSTTTATGVAWTVTGRELTFGQVSSVNSATELEFTTAVGAASGTYALARLHNDYRTVRYDQFPENCPDEELSLSLVYTAGTLSTTGTLGVGSVNGATFTQDGNGPDVSVLVASGDWAVFPDGHIQQITGTTGTTLVSVLDGVASTLADVEVRYVLPAFKPQTFDFDFTNGSDIVATGTDQTSVIQAGDTIQVAPTPTAEDSSSGPPVVVQAVTPTPITLTANYTGDTATGTEAVVVSRVPPLLLPTGQTTSATLTFDGTNRVTTTIAEPT